MTILGLTLQDARCEKIAASIMRTTGIYAANLLIKSQDSEIIFNMDRSAMIDLYVLLGMALDESDPINGKDVFKITEVDKNPETTDNYAYQRWALKD